MQGQITKVGIGRKAASLGLLLQVLLALAPLARAQGYIYNQMQIPGTEALAVADFNGDGIPDIVVGMIPNGFGICLGKADGTYAAPIVLDPKYIPSALAIGDFNGDGKLDLATVYLFGGNLVKVYLGNGDGTFQVPVSYNTGTSPTGIVAADFNGDQKLDLAVLNAADSTISVLFGNGDGTFQAQAVQPITTSASVILTADLNQDGRADLVTFNTGTANMSVLLGKADGTFTRIDSTLPTAGSAGALGDFNGDGIPDLVTSIYSSSNPSTFALYLGNGDGTFQYPTFVPIPYTENANAIAVGDFNADGKLDVAVGGSGLYSGGQVAVVLGNGNGTFTAGTTSIAVNGPPLLFADLNGDGLPDFVTGPYIELGAGDGTFAKPISTVVSEQAASTVVTGDFNGDGKLDVAFPAYNNGSYQMVTLPGNGDGTFGSPVLSAATGSAISGNWNAVPADLNGDGKLDLAFINQYQVAAVLGNGDGTFGGVVVSPFPTGYSGGAIAVGDFNRDGKADLAVTELNSSFQQFLQILLSNGDGTFAVGSQYALGPYGGVMAIAVADFNQDGILDLAVSDKLANTVSLFLGNGDGTFRPGTALPSIPTPLGLTAGDINRDGIPDLVVSSVNSDETCSLLAFLGNGDGTFQTPTATKFGGYGNCPGGLQLANLNGDGKPDLINGADFAFIGNGDGTFSPPISFATEFTNPMGVIVGDLNGDGVTDLGVMTTTGSTSSILNVFLGSPLFGAYPSPLSFEPTEVNMSSPPLTFNLVNLGAVPMSISSITAGGDFSQTNGCGDSLAPHASCQVDVVFSPTQTGKATGAVTFSDNAAPSPQIVSLAGVGTVGVANLGPSPLTFPGQLVGSVCTAQTATLNNTGTGPLYIAALSIGGVNSGDFAESDNCGTSVAAGGNCTINVTFTPTAVGTRTGTLTITDNNNGAAGSTQSVSLTGTGTAPAVSLSAAPTFPSEPVGTTSPAQTVTLTNAGTGSLSFTAIGVTGPFAIAASGTTCSTSSSVAPAGTCTVALTFTPTAVGAASGSLSFTDNASDSPETMALSGTGQGPVASPSPGSLTFGSQLSGTASSAQTITLTNSGNAGMTITSIAASANFAETNTCGTSLGAGAKCAISVTFKPTAGGSLSGAVSIADNALGSPQTVSLSGTGQDFALTVPTGSSSSATVSPGGTANYSLSFGGLGGLSQTINFTCMGAPSEATCTVNPTSVTPSGSGAVSIGVAVTTTAASLTAPPRLYTPPFRPGVGWKLTAVLLLALLISASLVLGLGGRKRVLRFTMGIAALVVLALALAACGGGGGGGGGGNPGTPAGTYNLVVTGTASGASALSHNMTLTLVVN